MFLHAGFLNGDEVAALNSTVLLDTAKFALKFALGVKPNHKEDSKVDTAVIEACSVCLS
jgi:hypothetical protein